MKNRHPSVLVCLGLAWLVAACGGSNVPAATGAHGGAAGGGSASPAAASRFGSAGGGGGSAESAGSGAGSGSPGGGSAASPSGVGEAGGGEVGGSAACGTSDPAAVIRAALTRQLAQPSFHETVDSQGASGATHAEFEYQAPDRVHTRVTVPGGKTIETIQVGSKAWNNVGAGWQPGIALDLSSVFASAGSIAADAPLSGVTLGGQESVNGAAATDYAFSATQAVSGVSTAVSGTIGIRAADCLPVKLVEQGTAAGATTGATITIDYSPVDIEPPA